MNCKNNKRRTLVRMRRRGIKRENSKRRGKEEELKVLSGSFHRICSVLVKKAKMQENFYRENAQTDEKKAFQ